MLVIKIDPQGMLGEKELATIQAKLRNLDEISMVPLNVSGENLIIGCDWSEFDNDWEFVHRIVRRQRSAISG